MDIPYSKREEIRTSPAAYLSFSSKAKRVFELFNESKSFDRRNLEKYLEELGRHDLKNELLPVEDEVANSSFLFICLMLQVLLLNTAE